MTANKPNVKRYDNMGCPEEICRVDTMYESDDGDYVLYEDYKALQAECEKLRKDAERLKARVAEIEGLVRDIRQHDINETNNRILEGGRKFNYSLPLNIRERIAAALKEPPNEG